MTRPVRWFACVAVLGTLVALGGCAPTESDDAATPASRPPVLLITLDTLRADAVGFESIKSPNLLHDNPRL